MLVLNSTVAVRNERDNEQSNWNRTDSSAERSEKPGDAAPRIFDGFADIGFSYGGPRLRVNDGVFAMGSCFAHELETALLNAGASVLSRDVRAEDPIFLGRKGIPDRKFFHRFTPVSMSQEFRCAFGKIPGWDDATTLMFGSDDRTLDFQYGWDITGDLSLNAAVRRRQIARSIVTKARGAKLIVVTLGLVEAWFHRPSGLYCNKIAPKVVLRQPDEFEFRMLGYEDVVQALEDLYSTLKESHERGEFDLLVTVSPVPLQKTFSGVDIIVANAEAKALQRAAAGEFVRRYANTHYFPSFEMVVNSNPAMAWRPDRVHVNREMVNWIIGRFLAAVYEDDIRLRA